jgi:hypothetical protein
VRAKRGGAVDVRDRHARSFGDVARCEGEADAARRR